MLAEKNIGRKSGLNIVMNFSPALLAFSKRDELALIGGKSRIFEQYAFLFGKVSNLFPNR